MQHICFIFDVTFKDIPTNNTLSWLDSKQMCNLPKEKEGAKLYESVKMR